MMAKLDEERPDVYAAREGADFKEMILFDKMYAKFPVVSATTYGFGESGTGQFGKNYSTESIPVLMPGLMASKPKQFFSTKYHTLVIDSYLVILTFSVLGKRWNFNLYWEAFRKNRKS